MFQFFAILERPGTYFLNFILDLDGFKLAIPKCRFTNLFKSFWKFDPFEFAFYKSFPLYCLDTLWNFRVG